MHTFTVPLPQPTDFAHLVTRIRQSSHGAFYRVKEGRIGRVLWVNARPRFIEVGLAQSQPGALEVCIHGGSASEETLVSKQITHLFSLGTDLTQFYLHASHDSSLFSLTTELAGARMIRDAGLFTSVISSIISQQLNLKFAAELKRRLWSLAGEGISVEGEVLFADPSPAAIAKLNYSELRERQYSQRKAEYVIDFARAVESGTVDLNHLSTMTDEDFILHLSKLRGLGRWTAECVLLFGLGRPDLLPANDVGLQKAVTKLYALPSRITEAELRLKAQSFAPWSSWYTYYLWLSLA